MKPLLSWLKTASLYLQEHYGDLASIVGLLVTLVGFLATIRRVKEAQHAAEEARLAAREAVYRIRSHLLQSEVGIALQLMRETEAACREGNWVRATYRCEEVKFRLTQLFEDPELEAEERLLLQFMVDEIALTMEALAKLERPSGSAQPTRPPSRLMKRLHKTMVSLGQIRGRLQTETLKV